MRAGELLDTIVQYIKKLPLFDKGMQTIDNRIMAPILLAISLRNLRVNKTRTILSVLGIIIGIFAICTLGMGGALFTETIDEIIEKNADIIIVHAVSEDETNPQYNFMSYLPMLSENDVSRIDKAVQAVTPDYSLSPLRRTVQQISVSQNADVSGMLIFGEKDKLEVVLGTRLIEGHLPRMNTDILVIKSFADTYNLRIGNHLKITANDGTEVRLKITGIVEDSLLAIVYSIIQSPNIVLLPEELYDILYSDTQKYSDSVSSAESKSYPFVMIRVADTTLREPVMHAIDREMNGKYRTINDDRVKT
ncbi:MAG TPA: ABC transporter permease, partial [Methanocorpusculum sp.]|nr:ABC transporter permease [Methanocorpusculum sp.]